MKQTVRCSLICLIVFMALSAVAVPLRADIPASERTALIVLYNATNGDNWNDNSGWKDGTLEPDGFAAVGSEGSWYGITADGEHVTEIWLMGNGLDGTIPPQIENLTRLTSLRLNYNGLTGPIPPELGNLFHLERINVGYNELSGSIPAELGNLQNLNSLSLYVNLLSGDIPPELGNLIELDNLNLEHNQLTGAIPPELGNLSQLWTLYLDSNQLSGGIPPQLGNLGGLVILFLSHNRLSGGIPPELGNLDQLRNLGLRSNRLTGEIPSSFMNLTELDPGFTSLGYNGLYTHDDAMRAYLNSKDAFWEETQTIAPSGITAAVLSGNSVRLSWTPVPGAWEIRYGGYEVYYSLTSGGPWRYSGITADKTPSFYDVTGLSLGTTYYFMIRTRTDAGLYNENTVISDPSGEVSATTTGPPPVYNLNLLSSPESGVLIKVSSLDIYGKGDGWTDFTRTYSQNTVITLTAPTQCKKKRFSRWLIDDVEHTDRRVTVTMDGPHTAVAVYEEVAKTFYTLTVLSAPAGGALITVSPPDSTGAGDGATGFSRVYEKGVMVTLAAPAAFNGDTFAKWTVDGKDKTTRSIRVKMTADLTAEAFFEPSEPPRPPEILLGKKKLKFRAVEGGAVTGTQSFTVTSVGGTLNWTASTDQSWLAPTPDSGAGSGLIHVSVDHTGLTEGHYTGTISVSDPEASNSPQTVAVQLKVYQSGASSPPFGEFTTPADGAPVSGSIAVTGWALDDIEMESVEIYREHKGALVFVGSATFVEGARGDIEQVYPDYPLCECGGWGYMMLTHLLPDGPHKLHAVAGDKEGLQATLGVKTVIVDNSNAVNPYGVIDTPAPGGTVSGSSYVNHGWVLTPQPNSIPRDGSTIDVYVDGAAVGKVSYNHYRPDVAEAFPGYANSDGAGGYFYLAAGAFDNGVHTISWTAVDDAGNAGGIGSRYFTVENAENAVRSRRSGVSDEWWVLSEELLHLPLLTPLPVSVKRGYNSKNEPEEVYPDHQGRITIKINPLERIVLHLTPTTHHSTLKVKGGFQVVGDRFQALPTGSTFDAERSVFYWQPGPGFLGEYRLVFIAERPGGEASLRDITVVIRPKNNR